MSPAAVIVLVGAVVASSCALVGSFLVLRRAAMLGDAISHSVLPGIVLAFLFTGSRAPLPMVVGAGALGVVTVFLVERLQRSRRLYEDASIGVVFPALFAIGVILVSRFAGQVDLDLDCVLYGEIAFAPWDILIVGGRSLGPKALWVNGAILLANLALVLVLWKELKLTSFDPGLAESAGIDPRRLHYVLMSAVSVTVVGAFESVGAILVVAMLVVPPATAYLLADRLGTLVVLAVAAGIASVGIGYAGARALDASVSGGIATAAGLMFVAAATLAPRDGLVARALSRRVLARRLAGDLVLVHLREEGGVVPVDAMLRRFNWPRKRFDRVLSPLLRAHRVSIDAGRVHLREGGPA